MGKQTAVALFLILAVGTALVPNLTAHAASAKEIDIETDAALSVSKKK